MNYRCNTIISIAKHFHELDKKLAVYKLWFCIFQINEVFLKSNISTYFYGTKLDALR